MKNKLSIKIFIEEFLRYTLQGEYSGPTIEKIREEMQSIASSPQSTLVIFADTIKHLRDKK